MIIDYCAIGKRIRKRRKSLNMTQAALAEKADLSDTNISHIERGATKLSLPSLIAIANALEVNADALLMDVVENSAEEFKSEFAGLIKDCSGNEYRMLYDICRASLEAFRKQTKAF